jgi:hypothetical protein
MEIERAIDVEQQHNRNLTRLRVVAEHVNRKLKIFRILGERYRIGVGALAYGSI